LAHSSVNGKCANYLTKQLVWQELFPDSLSPASTEVGVIC
jgi:hypothetical protein